MSAAGKIKELFGIGGVRFTEAAPPQPDDPAEHATATRVSLWPLNDAEYSIMYYGREVGYCGRIEGAPINFLRDDVTRLSKDDKLHCVRCIIDACGMPRATDSTRDLLETVANERLDD